jgi:acyl CoA:acetate/3-ketoacid CoA transferase beta subunit
VRRHLATPSARHPVTPRKDLGVLDVTPEGLALAETAPGVTVDEITARTGAPLLLNQKWL